jgi:proteasome accessory factor B
MGGASKVERLVNLIAMLLEAPRPMPFDRIRAALYRDQSEDASKRMFERDKEELRSIGIPVERAPTDVWGTEEGYQIPREEATLPDLGLSPDEIAALMLAAGAWEGDVGAAGPRMALLKLAASEGDAAEEARWMLPRVDVSEPSLPVVMDAIVRRKRIRFTYRTGGGGVPQQREVDPYALVHRGAWYLSGLDHLRGEVRRFKLARVDGLPELVSRSSGFDFSPPSEVPRDLPPGPVEADAPVTARVAFAPDVAWWVERRTGTRAVGQRSDGWVVIDLGVAELPRFVDWVMSFADDAVVLSPAEVRDAVLERLRDAAAG